jgi:hypothetical protein
MSLASRFINDQSGATAIEYGLIERGGRLAAPAGRSWCPFQAA